METADNEENERKCQSVNYEQDVSTTTENLINLDVNGITLQYRIETLSLLVVRKQLTITLLLFYFRQCPTRQLRR